MTNMMTNTSAVPNSALKPISLEPVTKKPKSGKSVAFLLTPASAPNSLSARDEAIRDISARVTFPALNLNTEELLVCGKLIGQDGNVDKIEAQLTEKQTSIQMLQLERVTLEAYKMARYAAVFTEIQALQFDSNNFVIKDGVQVIAGEKVISNTLPEVLKMLPLFRKLQSLHFKNIPITDKELLPPPAPTDEKEKASPVNRRRPVVVKEPVLPKKPILADDAIECGIRSVNTFKQVVFRDCAMITGDGLTSLLKHNSAIKELGVFNCKGVNFADIERIRATWRDLFVATDIKADALNDIASMHFGFLESLSLSDNNDAAPRSASADQKSNLS